MKTLMKFLSLMLIMTLAIFIIGQLDVDLGDDFYSFYGKLAELFSENMLPIISISLCCFCLERNDENYFLRIIPIYMIVGIILSIILNTIFEKDYFLYIAQQLGYKGVIEVNPAVVVLGWIYTKMQNTYTVITIVSLLFIIRSNNQITSILKKVTYGLLLVNIVLALWVATKTYMEKTLPNVYNYDGYNIGGTGFNFSSISDTEKVARKVYVISEVGIEFTIILLFITNYAFATSTNYNVDDIDLYETKMEAERVAEEKMKQMYQKEPPKEEPNIDRSQSENGLMNVNNQLGVESNVGNVKEAAKTTIENDGMDLMYHSQGPVINETMSKEPLKDIENPVKQFENSQPIESTPEVVQQTEQNEPIPQDIPNNNQ